jgi:putative transcriptional regulator
MRPALKPHNERLARLAITDLEKAFRGEPSSYTRLELPEPATVQEVKAARKAVHSTQRQFAQTLGVSLETVKAWEAGKRTPEGVATKVLRLLKAEPKLALKLAKI